MASKKTGRLAGLAALAGAAYLANKKGMFGGKGEGESKSDAKDTAADREDADMGKAMRDNMAASKKADDITVSGEGGFDAPADMSRVSRVGTPASVTRSEKASSASVAPTSSQTQRFAPSGSPVLSSGAGSGGPRIVGLGRSSGRGGAEAGEEAAYKSAKQAQALKDFSAKRPGIMARMREKDKAMMEDGGKSMVDRQDAGAKKAGLSVDDYYGSGKAQIDKQDGTFKKGGAVKKMASGGMTSSASKRGDGIASKGKTRCKMY
jgi:hypothetical protein